MKEEEKRKIRGALILLALLILLYLTVPKLFDAWTAYTGYEDESMTFYSSENVHITYFSLLFSIFIILIFILAYIFYRDMHGEGEELKIRK